MSTPILRADALDDDLQLDDLLWEPHPCGCGSDQVGDHPRYPDGYQS